MPLAKLCQDATPEGDVQDMNRVQDYHEFLKNLEQWEEEELLVVCGQEKNV